MISVQQAEKIITDSISPAKMVVCPLEKAQGELLRESIRADRDIPPCHKVLMDGIAVNASEFKKGRRTFPIEGTQAAGAPPRKLKKRNSCIEIMTGAVLPAGATAVIPVEYLRVENGSAIVIRNISLKDMQHVQPRGSDHRKGEILIKQGELLTPSKIAVAASVGKSKVKLSRRPSVTVVSTGDEILPVTKRPQVYQIRTSNSHALNAALQKNGYHSVRQVHIRDDKKTLTSQLRKILQASDVVILSGGVSMGKFDFVPQVLKTLGVKVLFHKVNQKPGKPFWFGKTRRGTVVFALPGNPVSTQVCFYRYVLPALARSRAINTLPFEYAKLSGNFTAQKDITLFMPVKIERRRNAETLVHAHSISHSGDFVGLSESEGFVELAAGRTFFPAQSVVPLYRW